MKFKDLLPGDCIFYRDSRFSPVYMVVAHDGEHTRWMNLSTNTLSVTRTHSAELEDGHELVRGRA